MKLSLTVTDWMYRISHTVRRNRFTVLIYLLLCLLFLVVGIAVGINIPDKHAYVGNNGAPIFRFLRGDSGIVVFFFADTALSCVYCLFAASMFFNRATAFLSAVPCAYRSYILGLHVSVIVVVFSVSAIPMLFVLFVPISIIEIGILCLLSVRCFTFTSLNCGCRPSRSDLKEYYAEVLRFLFAIVICGLVKSITVLLFGTGLVGV